MLEEKMYGLNLSALVEGYDDLVRRECSVQFQNGFDSNEQMYSLTSLVEDGVISDVNNNYNNNYCSINPALSENNNFVQNPNTFANPVPTPNNYCSINPALSEMSNNQFQNNYPIQNQTTNNIAQINPALDPNLVVPENFVASDMIRAMTPRNRVISNPKIAIQEPVFDYGDFTSAVPDPDLFNQYLANESLESLCARFPYQQLKVDDNGRLAMVNPNCGYNALFTNAFHVLFHLRQDKLNKQQQQYNNNQIYNQTPINTTIVQDQQVQQPIPISFIPNDAFTPEQKVQIIEQIVPGASQQQNIFTPIYNRPGYVASKLVDLNSVASDNSNEVYTINADQLVEQNTEPAQMYGCEHLEGVFHMEKTPPPKYDYGIEYRNYVQTGNEGFSFDYNSIPETIEINTNVPVQHPNPDYGKRNPFVGNNMNGNIPNTYPSQNPYQQMNNQMMQQPQQFQPQIQQPQMMVQQPYPQYQYNPYVQQQMQMNPYYYQQMMQQMQQQQMVQMQQQMMMQQPYQYNPYQPQPQMNYGFNDQNFVSGIIKAVRDEEPSTKKIIPKSYSQPQPYVPPMTSSRYEPIDPTNPFENCGGPEADHFHDMVDLVRAQLAEIENLEKQNNTNNASDSLKSKFQMSNNNVMFNQGYNNMALAQNNARTIYNQQNNSNMVDFSSPESMNRSQITPYNTVTSPMMNPMIPQVMNPNLRNTFPVQYGRYQGNWYGNGYNVGCLPMNNISLIMRPVELDKENIWTVETKAVREPISDEEIESSYNPPKEDYFTRLRKSFENIKVIGVRGYDDCEDEKEEKQEKEIENTEFIDKTLDQMEQLQNELDPETFEVPEDHKLVWNEEKKNKVEKLCEQIAIYDIPLAHVIWNIPEIEQMTEEMSEFWIEYGKERLEFFQTSEKRNPNVDYRIPLRHRKTPMPISINDQGQMKFSPIPYMYPEKKYDENGNRIYDYDRKRKLTKDERELFNLKAIFDLRTAELQKRTTWILQFNIDKNKRLKTKDKNGRREYSLLKEYKRKNPNFSKIMEEDEESFKSNNGLYGYGYVDPFQTWVRERQKMVERQKYVYLKAFDHSMTLEEFNTFWEGPQSNFQQIDPTERRRQELLQATRIRIAQINYAEQHHEETIRNYVNQVRTAEAKRIRELDEGCMDGVTTAKEYFDKMGYLWSLCMEDDLKKHQEEKYNQYNRQFNYKRALIQNVNEHPELNNFRPGAVFGKADPEYGFPPNYLDLTKTDKYEKCKAEFMDYCKNSIGVNMPLKPIYR